VARRAANRLAVHSDAPLDRLFALLLLGAAAAVNLYRRGRHAAGFGRAIPARRLAGPLWVGLGCILAILSFNGMSYLKFGSFGGSPFKYQHSNSTRRAWAAWAAAISPRQSAFNFAAYLTRPTFQLKPAFPFVFYTGLDSTGRGGVVNGVLFLPDAGFAADRAIRMDVTEPTLGLALRDDRVGAPQRGRHGLRRRAPAGARLVSARRLGRRNSVHARHVHGDLPLPPLYRPTSARS